MKKSNLLAIILVLLSAAHLAAANSKFMPLEQLKPGMKGTGLTVFKGQEIETFQCEILGILKNIGPNQNAIIAKLSGKNLEQTGIFAGMSGSPVYVEGRMIGAVAWSLPFLKEPIAGITPIEEMIDVFRTGKKNIRAGLKKIVGLRRDDIAQREFATLPGTPGNQGLTLALPGSMTADAASPGGAGFSRLRYIATPVAFSGFGPEALQMFTPQFHRMGMATMQGGGGGAPGQVRRDVSIEPGSTIAVSLVSGDMDISASGTVTYRDGDKIYAFGHPFLNIGTTDMPLSRADVLAVLPSLQTSQKMSVGADLVGIINQDRSLGIQGVLGEKPNLIPVSVTVRNQQNRRRQFSYQVVNDQFLTPFLLNLTIFNTILSSERSIGFSTLQVRGKITLEGQPEIRIEDSFSSSSNSPIFASLAVSQPVGFLLASGYENLRFKNIELEINAFEDMRDVLLDRVWYDRTEVHPGDELQVKAFLKKVNGQVVVKSYPIKIAEDISPGALFVMVGDGESIQRMDSRRTRGIFIPRDLGHLIKIINNLKKKDRLYVRLFRYERGAVVGGEGLPGLPPSIYTLLQSPKTRGGIDPITISTFVEHELPATDFVINGMQVFRIQVQP